MTEHPDDGQVRARVQRMLQAARDRLADSRLLSRSMAEQSDADHLLELLAFEILLKAIHLIHAGTPGRSHSYNQLFDALPSEVSSNLVKAAAERMSTYADYSDLPNLLSTFSRNFVDLRYPYEAYEELSAQEYAELGQSWVDRGAREQDATFIYHAEELYGLIHALEEHLSTWLASVLP